MKKQLIAKKAGLVAGVRLGRVQNTNADVGWLFEVRLR